MSHHFTDICGDVEKIICEVFADFTEKLDVLGQRANGIHNAHCTVHCLNTERNTVTKQDGRMCKTTVNQSVLCAYLVQTLPVDNFCVRERHSLQQSL